MPYQKHFFFYFGNQDPNFVGMVRKPCYKCDTVTDYSLVLIKYRRMGHLYFKTIYVYWRQVAHVIVKNNRNRDEEAW